MNAFLFVVVSITSATLYICANLFAANWLLGQNWNLIRRHINISQRKAARFFASQRILNLSTILAILLSYGLYQLSTATTIWSYSFALFYIGLLPIWASFLIFDKLFFLIEPKSIFVKSTYAVIVAAFIWFIKAVISDELNEIFPFDPGAIPVALSAAIFLTITGFATLLSAFASVIIVPLLIFALFDRIIRKKNSFKNLIIATLPFSLFLAFQSSGLALQIIGLSPLRNLLISRIAFEYDFNSNYLCHKIENGLKAPLNKNEKVLFIGSTQKLGIAATANELPQKAFSSIKKSEIRSLHPFDFYPVVCNNP